MTRIIILGSSGFIGGRLHSLFSSEGADVAGYSSAECNLLSEESVESVLSGMGYNDAVVMASSIPRLRENTNDSMVKNIVMASNLSPLIEKKRLKRLVFLSSTDIYGNYAKIISENSPLSPNDPYSISKLASEYILINACRKTNTPFLILRLSGVYGPGDLNKSTIFKLVNSAVMDGKITVYGDGLDKRDFVFVDDIFQIVKSAIESRESLMVNIATGTSHTILQISEVIKSNLGGNIITEFKPCSAAERSREQSFDVSFLRKNFPGVKLTSLDAGIAAYIKTVQERVFKLG